MSITCTSGNGSICSNLPGVQSSAIVFHVSGAAGQTITFAAAGGGQTGMVPASGVTDGSGNATFTFRPTGTVQHFPIDSYVLTATAGGSSVVFYAFFADIPPTASYLSPTAAYNQLVTAPTTYTVRVGGNSYIPNVEVHIDTFAAGVWTLAAGPTLTDGTGTATLLAPLSGVGYFRIAVGGVGGPLGVSPIPYDTTGGTGPAPFPFGAVTVVGPAPAYPTGAPKGASTVLASAVPSSSVMQLPPGMRVTDPQFVPTLNDRLRQLAQAAASASSGVNVGTHAARLALAPTKAGAGAFYIETDPTRMALYYVAQPAGGANQWRLAFANGSGLLANRPIDLKALDVGFRYLSTDAESTAVWSGSAWTPLAETAPTVACTHAQRIAADPNPFDAANYADGTLLFETDRTFTYRALQARWIYLAGTMRLTASALHALVVATTDPLTSRDTGALFYTTDYGHVSRYNEAGAMEWAPGAIGERPGSYVFSHEDPSTDPQMAANAWHVCDGSSQTLQNADGSTRAVTVPASAAAIAPGSSAPLYIRR